ncbi:MAG: NAD(P)H-hydrate dehydratase [Phycisphaerae bacterium]
MIISIPKLPARRRDANKGDFGRILIVGGSRDMPGAISLAANSALRSGAGLVTVAIPDSIQQTVVSLAPCATSMPLPRDEHGLISQIALPDLIDVTIRQKKFDVIAVGPGLGRAQPMVTFINEINRAGIPIVIDADALNLLSEIDWHSLLDGPCVITPHPGELSRLLKTSISQIQSDRQNFAVRTAKLMKGNSSVCLLKGEQTVVTDGEQIYINQTGNPGMATGGAGDVLTGVIAALMGQKLSPFDAAVLGAYVHGLAGDLAAKELGEISLTASDLLRFLPSAFKTNQKS